MHVIRSLPAALRRTASLTRRLLPHPLHTLLHPELLHPALLHPAMLLAALLLPAAHVTLAQRPSVVAQRPSVDALQPSFEARQPSRLTLHGMPPAGYPAIHARRPRICADSARLDWLRAHVAVPGDCMNTFRDMRYAYEHWWINDPQVYVEGDDSTRWHWDWSSVWAGQQVLISTLIAQLTDDALEWKRCRFVARQLHARLDTAHYAMMEWYEKENLLRAMSDAGGMLLDWCHDRLAPDDRAHLAQAMYAMTREFMTTYISSGAGNSYVSSHNTWNTIFCHQNTLVLDHAADLTAAQHDTVQQWYRDLYDKITQRFIPVWTYYRDDDGGWNWGAAYAMWSLVDQFQLFENSRTGTDKNFFTDLPWVRESINQYVYFIQPDGMCIHLGDGETAMRGDRVTYLHARLFQDPRSLWMAQYWSDPARTPNTMDKYAKLLYHDFTAASVSRPAPPLTWFADKVGLAVSLSSWESDASMVTFFNSPSKRAAHEHRDNNAFMIFKRAPLLIDAGYYDSYGSAHYRDYYQRTIAHNSIVVRDSSARYTCFGSAAANDGGQIESSALMNYDDIFRAENQRGRWLRHVADAGFTYSAADAQLSYDTSVLDLFRRRLVHLKPDRVLVLDHVHIRNRATRQRDIAWIGHSADRPVITALRIDVPVPGHIETFEGGDAMIAHHGGSLALRTLLPAQSTMRLIGGAGHEYWVDGANRPPLTAPDTAFYTPGAWRIEVRPVITSDTVVFLHSIDIGDSLRPARPGGSLLRSAVSIAVDWRDTVCIFPASADTSVRVHHLEAVSGGRLVHLVAFDLAADNYAVRIDGIEASRAMVAADGTLQTALPLPAGAHDLEIRSVMTGVGTPPDPRSISVHPHPVTQWLNVFMEEGGAPPEIDVYTTLGVHVLHACGRHTDVSSLARGIYLAHVRTPSGVRLLRFVKQ